LLLILISLFGSLIASITCCFQSDSKRLIAYSSIAHINFIISILFSFFLKRKNTTILVIVSHGFISGLIFFFIGSYFYFCLTRLLYFSFLSYKTINLNIIFFIIILFSNFGVPPFISRIREIIIFSILIKKFFLARLLLFFYAIIICYVCIFFLLLLIHGKKR